MSVPSIVKGQYFDVAVDVTTLGLDGLTGWILLCGLNTRNLTHQVNTSDEYIRDCGQPDQTPWRVLNETGQQKDIAGTGLHNRAQGDLIRAIFGKTLPYRFIEGEPGNDLVSQGYWEGPFKLTNWQEGAADGANVTSQFTFSSDGEIVWASSVAPTLIDLTVTPLTATSGSPWTGTPTGMAPGSTFSIQATGATAVSIDETTGVAHATWSTTGSKTVKITETNPEATNSPHVTTVTVVVS